MGGFTVSSKVTVRAKDPSPGTEIKEVEILSSRVQICDLFNFKIDSAKAVIPIPVGIDVPPLPEGADFKIGQFNGYQWYSVPDSYYNAVEVSGGAKQYRIYSEVFEAPESVRAPFKIENGAAIP